MCLLQFHTKEYNSRKSPNAIIKQRKNLCVHKCKTRILWVRYLDFHDSECHRRYFPTRCVATVVHVVGARSTRRVYADLDTTPSGPPRLGGDPQGKDTKLWVLVFVAPRIATASMDKGKYTEICGRRYGFVLCAAVILPRAR